MNWEDALRRLYALERRGIKLDLDRVAACLEAIGRPDRSFASILVAGTNGKGSTAAALASALARAGYRTGLYTSPHLIDFRERIRVDGRLADQGALQARMARDGERWEASELTFFEATTMLALGHFQDAAVEVAVLEVGMGGRLDATNTVEPILSVVTALGMDHAHALGSTAAAIAREKAGILRAGVPAVVNGGALGGPAAVAARAALLGSPLYRRRDCARIDRLRVAAISPEPVPGRVPEVALRFRVRPRLSAPPGCGLPEGGLELSSSLPGVHQAENLSLAALSLSVLRARGWRLPEEAIVDGIARLRWPGRLDRPRDDLPLVADVAHNREGARVLARALAPLVGRVRPVVGMVTQKDHEGFFRALRRVADQVELAPLADIRGAPVDELAGAAERAGWRVRRHPTVAQALSTALGEVRRAAGEIVLLCGSFHTLDEGYHALGIGPLARLWDNHD